MTGGLARVGLPALAAIAAGAGVAVQARVNGELAARVGNPLEAAAVSFAVGLGILSVALTVSPRTRGGLRRVGTDLRQRRLKWWQVAGGVLGGAFVAVQSATVPIVGVAIFAVGVVAGQVVNSLLVDRLGVGPAGRQPFTVYRLGAAVLALVAVVVSVWQSIPSGVVPPVALIATLAAGAFIAFQQAINGRVGAAAGNVWSATWLNFALGSVVLGAGLGLAWALSDLDPVGLPPGPLWLYLGGLLGVLFIAAAAWVVQRLGVLLFALLSISGQLAASVLLDLLAPAADGILTANLVLGVVIAGTAVTVATLPPWFRSRRASIPARA